MGPLSIEQIESMGVDNTAYVWHSGLDDWVKITKVSELNEMLKRMANAEIAPETSADTAEAMPAVDVPELPADEVPELPPNYVRQPGLPIGNAPREARYFPQPTGGHFAASQAVSGTPECPPTNLVWAIITTLCCCMPLGVLGIVFATLTKKHYKQGDYLKAEKYSEYGAWAIIAAIIIGLITTPLSCSYSMMLQNLA